MAVDWNLSGLWRARPCYDLHSISKPDFLRPHPSRLCECIINCFKQFSMYVFFYSVWYFIFYAEFMFLSFTLLYFFSNTQTKFLFLQSVSLRASYKNCELLRFSCFFNIENSFNNKSGRCSYLDLYPRKNPPI